MAGTVSNLVRIGGMALAMQLGLALVPKALAQASTTEQGDAPNAPPATADASLSAADSAVSEGRAQTDGSTQGAEPPPVPTDAISALANPPDGATPQEAAAPPPLPPAPDISVTASRLLSVQIDGAGAETSMEAKLIPYVVGKSCYKWELTFTPVEGDLTLSEQLTLPGPARNWNATPADKTSVNPQGTAATTERHFDASAGVATAGWCIAPSDPIGAYRYIIRQGDREVARFDFTVGDLL